MTSATSDEELAHILQLQFDSEAVDECNTPGIGLEECNGNEATSDALTGIVDSRWDLIDPNPDIRALFLQFNGRFFWGRLEGVEVRWSPRMTLCAGLCCYEGYGGLCSIRLSQPLLKLRPRSDLVETLLHEMIHAYLFVTQNNKDHDGHGPEFCKHMNRINSSTGTKISIYHTFHNEVESYRQHWWRCDGPCQQRKPYFGYVKRAMNRAPSPRDFWWAEHQKTCGGRYTKIKEPEGYGEKKGKKKKDDDAGCNKGPQDTNDKPSKPGADIRNFIPFCGKGQTLGGGSSSASSSSSSSSTSDIQPSGPVASGSKIGVSGSQQRSSSDDRNSQSDVLSSSIKKPSGSLSAGNLETNFWGGRTVGKPSNSSVSGSSGGDGKGTVQRPRFTPVVATAGGRRVTDTGYSPNSKNSSLDTERQNMGRDMDSEKERTRRRFIPVVAAVGRKESSFSRGRIDEFSSAQSNTKSMTTVTSSQNQHKDCTMRTHSDSDPSTGRQMPNCEAEASRTRTDWKIFDIGRSKKGSGEPRKNKRARLVDLQAMFDDSDSEEERLESRPAKHPRVSANDDDDQVDDDVSIVNGGGRRIGAGSDKENAGRIQNPIVTCDGSDDETEGIRNATRLTTGIWKDLSTTPSGQSALGTRRFGRVSPPLFGRYASKGRRDEARGNSVPRSSFCEHPWQTAARESGQKTASPVTRVNETDGVINLTTMDDENGVSGRGFGAEGRVGPKTVPCPVCNLQIEERKINLHLDTCLTYNCDALFCP